MCDERETLLAYLYEEADPAERGRVEAHLEACETCRDEIAGLQSVREDLLAWDVPDHGSVWRPFVSARSWSFRDLPAWGMAAAACVMLALGALGGAAASAVTARAAAPGAVVSSASAVTVSPLRAAVTPAELASLERRVKLVESGARLAPPIHGMPASFTTADALAGKLSDADRQWILSLITDEHSMVVAMNKENQALSTRVDALSTQVTQLLNQLQGGQPGGQ